MCYANTTLDKTNDTRLDVKASIARVSALSVDGVNVHSRSGPRFCDHRNARNLSYATLSEGHIVPVADAAHVFSKGPVSGLKTISGRFTRWIFTRDPETSGRFIG